MAEDREAVRQHVQQVREKIYRIIRVPRFTDAEKLISRFERIVTDWEQKRAGGAEAIIEAVNELCVAARLLTLKNATTALLIYEPQVTPSGKSIDFMLALDGERHYFDVKSVRPRDLDAERAWDNYEDMREHFPDNTDVILAKNFMGGEFWHYMSTARSRFLEHSLGLERKISEMTDSDGNASYRLEHDRFRLKHILRF